MPRSPVDSEGTTSAATPGFIDPRSLVAPRALQRFLRHSCYHDGHFCVDGFHSSSPFSAYRDNKTFWFFWSKLSCEMKEYSVSEEDIFKLVDLGHVRSLALLASPLRRNGPRAVFIPFRSFLVSTRRSEWCLCVFVLLLSALNCYRLVGAKIIMEVRQFFFSFSRRCQRRFPIHLLRIRDGRRRLKEESRKVVRVWIKKGKEW